MTKRLIIIVFFIFIIFSFFSLRQDVVFVHAESDGTVVNLDVEGCDNNGVCEPSIGETILSCPTDCTQSTGGSSLVMDNVFSNLTVEVSYNSAIIRWKSTVPTMSNIKWGTNSDYKDGVLKNINFLSDHKVEITNLKDGTLYYFSIQGESLLGKTNSLENQIFRTLSLPDTTSPSNPTNVKAESINSGITVSWENPQEEDFDYIRVMKNTDRYYGSPDIGYLMYEGKGTYFTDSNVILNHKYFYSLFSRDRTGNYSSGSLVDIIYNPGSKDIKTDLSQVIKIEPLTNIYTASQGTVDYDFKIGDIVSLESDKPIKIKTNYSSKSNNDDMWVEIIDKDNNVNKYLFSRIKDKDGFITADIPSFKAGGYYSVNIYRYENGRALIVSQGAFLITKIAGGERAIFTSGTGSGFILLILAIILLFFMVLPRLLKLF